MVRSDHLEDAILHNTHIGRELASVGIGWDQGWANDMAALLLEMNNAAHATCAKGWSRLPRRVLAAFHARYDELTQAGLAGNPHPTGRKQDTLEAAGYNLAAALMKLKPGATRFATVRSDLATAAKHDVGALDVLVQLFKGEAWMPPRTI